MTTADPPHTTTPLHSVSVIGFHPRFTRKETGYTSIRDWNTLYREDNIMVKKVNQVFSLLNIFLLHTHTLRTGAGGSSETMATTYKTT
jgi:hypothetical protein